MNRSRASIMVVFALLILFSISENVLARPAFVGRPDYDSGWVAVAQDTRVTLNHGLGGNIQHYVVDMQCLADEIYGVNHMYYGGADFGNNPPAGHAENDRVGAYWRDLTTSQIAVYRRPEDTFASRVRIRIWIDPNPDYNTAWVGPLAGGPPITVTHNLGGDPDDYIVDVLYQSSAGSIHQRYYGGIDFGATAFEGMTNNEMQSLYWFGLTDTEVQIFRRGDDEYINTARVRIFDRPAPSYDSGWSNILAGQVKTYNFDIGGRAEDYVVDLQFRSDTGSVHQRYYGGIDFGSSTLGGAVENDRAGVAWFALTDSSVSVVRRQEDDYANDIRVRVYDTPAVSDDSSGSTGVRSGINQSVFETGFLVPYATYDEATGTNTVVGIFVNDLDLNYEIYWSYLNANGTLLAHGSILTEADVYDYSFSLASEASGSGEGTNGWLIFTYDQNGILDAAEGVSSAQRNIAGNAFLINMSSSDAPFVPVIPLCRADYLNAAINLNAMTGGSIRSLLYGHDSSSSAIGARYLVDPDGDPRTYLVIFTPEGAPGSFTVDMHKTTGAFAPGLIIPAGRTYLNVIDVQSVAPEGFTEGSIWVDNEAANPIGLMFGMSYYSFVGAEQTTLGIAAE